MERSRSLCSLSFVMAIQLAVAACPAWGHEVVINEVMALNAPTLADDSGRYADWIELHNATTQAVDVGGMYLTDDLRQPTMWQIPAGRPVMTTIPPRGYLLVWADQAGTDAGLHAALQPHARAA